MTSINPTSAADFNQAAYYNITEDITLNGNLSIPQGSVLDFCGGSICGSGTINLNGAKVVAAPYCIFCKDVSVSGFAQSEVLAEWFNDPELYADNNVGEEVLINKAILSAHGCPVVLDSRRYSIQGSVKFIAGLNHQTLICPGELYIDSYNEDTIAILLDNVSYVTLKINTIQGKATQNTDGGYTYRGIGISFRGQVHMAVIDLFRAQGLKIGLDLSPKATPNIAHITPQKSIISGPGDIVHPPLASLNYAFIQNCKFKFNLIRATTCIRIDLFAKNKLADYKNCWITSNQFYGGRLRGENGIVFGTPGANFFEGGTETCPAAHAHSLVFENIAIEQMSNRPVYLAYVSQSKFINTRMMQSLPGGSGIEGNTHSPWIALYNVSNIEIGMIGHVNTSHLSIVDESTEFPGPDPAPQPYFSNIVDNIIVKGDVLDSDWYVNHFDTVVFRTSYTAENVPVPRMFVTSSIQPFNMAKVVTRDDFETQKDNDSLKPQIIYRHEILLTKLIPKLDIAPSAYKDYTNPLPPDCHPSFDVLPDTVFFDLNNTGIEQNLNEWKILLNGIWRFPQMIPSLYIKLPSGSNVNKIIFVPPTDKSIKMIKDFEAATNGNISFNKGGLFKLAWEKQETVNSMVWPILRIIHISDQIIESDSDS